MKFVVNCNVLYRVLYVESESVSQSVRVSQSVIFENRSLRSLSVFFSEAGIHSTGRRGLSFGQGEGVKEPIQNRFVIGHTLSL